MGSYARVIYFRLDDPAIRNLLSRMSVWLQPAYVVTGAGRVTRHCSVPSLQEESFSDWYTEIIVAAEMIDYYDVGGCYILRPWSYAIWEKIQRYMDE